jgi:hypothetical protein
MKRLIKIDEEGTSLNEVPYNGWHDRRLFGYALQSKWDVFFRHPQVVFGFLDS